MPTAARPQLEPGRVYRTRDFAPWARNAPRLAKRLEREGVLIRLRNGLFLRPRAGRFGPVPPSDGQLLRRFLDDSPFVVTGPERWNALGLGTTAAFVNQLVYNQKRSGMFALAGRVFDLRKVAFPEHPPKEWYVVDLFENAERAGASRADLERALATALRRRAFDARRLRRMAEEFGRKRTQAHVERALTAAAE
jgi:hypothetical protein